MILTGSIVNALAIAAGSLAGLLLKWLTGRFAGLLPAGADALGRRLQTIIMQGIALCVLYIGIDGCLQGSNSLIAIVSMVLGALIGEALDLDRRMHALGDWVQKKTAHLAAGGSASVSEGFVTASLLFCVGAMAIVGALQDGLTGDHSTLFSKSMLDGISSIVFASSLGIGVLFSAVAVLLYQGSIALLASSVAPLLQSNGTIEEMTCVGSLMIIALSLNMLGLTKIKVMNLVPACLLPILLCRFM